MWIGVNVFVGDKLKNMELRMNEKKTTFNRSSNVFNFYKFH